ncbi:hypothetical protein N8T08_010822 [Aspergillus melleus]|uniref:Uncharacterized protein n=1 Tax=Aspergillus melleus TaxID=138277 RepID=A0ACC3BD03_9EURO|nr:hypothetical protein N8T08_010822 [Aspergillus melleus]
MAELTVAPERALESGHLVTFEIPSLLRLNRAHPKVTAEVLVRSAMALLIVSHTNNTHEFFMSFEGSRSKFPFDPPSSSSSRTAIDVAGPGLSFVLNLIAFKPQETVLIYLCRVQQESAELGQHLPVPYHEVFPHLNCTDDVLVRAAESLIFNWMPRLGALASGANHFQNMAMTQLHIRTNIGS